MADIRQHTNAIMNAVYGEEVRGSIVEAINKVNDDNNHYQAIKDHVDEVKSELDEELENIAESINSVINESEVICGISDEIDKIKHTFTNLYDVSKPFSEFEIIAGKTLSESNGGATTKIHRTAVNSFLTVYKGDRIILDSAEVVFCVYCFNNDGTFRYYYRNIGGNGNNWSNIVEFSDSDGFNTNISYPMKVRLVLKPLNESDSNCDSLIEPNVIRSKLSYATTGKSSSAQASIKAINSARRIEKSPSSSEYSSLTLSSGRTIDAYVNMVKRNYNSFMSEAKGNESIIPFIAFTDVHQRLVPDEDLFKLINDVVNWEEISAVISLGDIVYSQFEQEYLDDFTKVMDNIPLDKRISIMGNHDATRGAEANPRVDDVFKTIRAHRFDNHSNFTVDDDYWNVRYISTNFMTFSGNHTYTKNGVVTSDMADWIVEELSKTDRRDIIMLSHIYYYNSDIIQRNGTTFNGQDNLISNDTARTSFRTMIENRKNKTSGTLIDSSGGVHPYDFSNCKGNLLATLHGHHHEEGYKTSNNLTQFLFQSFGATGYEKSCFYFAYINRTTNKLKVWRNVIGDNGSAWSISI